MWRWSVAIAGGHAEHNSVMLSSAALLADEAFAHDNDNDVPDDMVAGSLVEWR